jgi:biotin-(acetyl-CoA carboxylase) ligase
LWLEKAYKLNQEISVNQGEEIICGTFKDIDLDGNLIIETLDGRIHKLLIGEIFFGK